MRFETNSRTLYRAAAAAAVALLAQRMASAANDGSAIDFTGSTYSQNFNSLPVTPVDGYNISPEPTENSWTDNSTIAGWYANESGLPAPNVLYVSDGTPKTKGTLTGGLYSLGSTSIVDGNPVGDPDRSLGVAATSTSGTVTLGMKLYNDTANTYNSFTLNYNGEEWFTGEDSAQRDLSFASGIDNASETSGSFTTSASLSYLSPVDGTSEYGTGNTSPYQVPISSTVFTSSPWAPGHYLWLTWSLPAAAQGPALGIDDLSFSATPAPPSRQLTWNPPGTTWKIDPGTTNWLDQSNNATAFTSTDTADFTNTGVGTVTIDAGGVTDTATNVSNTTGTYTFTGGAIGGGPLTKTGAGTLVINDTNTFTGVNVDGGTVEVTTDGNLGGPGGIAFDNGGTLQTDGPISTNRAITVNTGGGEFNTGGFDSTFSGPLGLQGPFVKAGAGTLAFSGLVTSVPGSQVSITGGNLQFNESSGTETLVPPSTTGGFDGNIIVDGTTRVSFASPGGGGGSLSGSGQIQFAASGGALVGATLAGTTGVVTTTIDMPIVINSNNISGPFNATIGESTAGNTMILTSNAVISGQGDLVYSNSLSGGGAGLIELGAANTYTGSTTVNLSGIVQLNNDGGIPTGSALAFGDGVNTANLGTLDLNGHGINIASLATNLPGSGQTANGISNSSVAAATITVNGSATTTFAGTIGAGYQVNNGGDDIGLTLASTNTGSLTLTGQNTYTGGTDIEGGTLIVGVAGALQSGTAVTNKGSFMVQGDTSVSSVSSTLVPSGTTTVAASVNFTSGAFSQAAFVNNGMAILDGGGNAGNVSGTGTLEVDTAALVAKSVSQSGITVNSVLNLASHANGGASSYTKLLTLAGGTTPTATLDVADEGIVVDYAGGSTPISTIYQQIKTAYNGGGANAWKGTGITSSVAKATPLTYGVGYAESSVVLGINGGTWMGQTVNGTSVLVRETYLGDLNLDGQVTSYDLSVLLNHYNQHGQTWATGDFDYDGYVGPADLSYLLNNYKAPALSPLIIDVSQYHLDQTADNLLLEHGFTLVPEPSVLGLLSLAGLGLMGRRRRASRNS